MEDALKETKIKTAKRRKMKKRIVLKDEIQLEIILDDAEEEVEKEVDDDIEMSVLQCKKLQRKEETRWISKSSKKKEKSNVEMERLTRLLAQWDADIMNLKEALQEALAAPIEEPSPMNALHQQNDALKAKIGDLA
ncbi:hypothetical protein HAX54_027634 [Datura stramonium]|uniref:Uncharacterized protein n=1 Tax=Datura stramonium TaxID=4076 RepID=A0ABS8V412_DATST|nr:hypothetical protein [Datura stramonium]